MDPCPLFPSQNIVETSSLALWTPSLCSAGVGSAMPLRQLTSLHGTLGFHVEGVLHDAPAE